MHVELASTQSSSQARTVQVIVLYQIDRPFGYSISESVAIHWKTVVDCVEKLVSRPNLFLIFPSLHSASAFRQNVATPNMPRLVSQGRLKYVVEGVQTKVKEAEGTWSLVEPDADDGWRVLSMFLLISGGPLH